MKIYLAGKIAKNDWRNVIINARKHDYKAVYYTYVDGDDSAPEAPFTIDGVDHEYVGPFFQACDHGCGHGDGSHGVLGDWSDGNPCLGSVRHGDAECTRSDIVESCLSGVARADLVFAWIERADAHGTLTEIGYAVGLGTPITALCFSPTFNAVAGVQSDLWFATHSVDLVIKAGYDDGPREALRKAIKWASGRLRNS